jgi:hypothetical protein
MKTGLWEKNKFYRRNCLFNKELTGFFILGEIQALEAEFSFYGEIKNFEPKTGNFSYLIVSRMKIPLIHPVSPLLLN